MRDGAALHRPEDARSRCRSPVRYLGRAKAGLEVGAARQVDARLEGGVGCARLERDKPFGGRRAAAVARPVCVGKVALRAVARVGECAFVGALEGGVDRPVGVYEPDGLPIACDHDVVGLEEGLVGAEVGGGIGSARGFGDVLQLVGRAHLVGGAEARGTAVCIKGDLGGEVLLDVERGRLAACVGPRVVGGPGVAVAAVDIELHGAGQALFPVERHDVDRVAKVEVGLVELGFQAGIARKDAVAGGGNVVVVPKEGRDGAVHGARFINRVAVEAGDVVGGVELEVAHVGAHGLFVGLNGQLGDAAVESDLVGAEPVGVVLVGVDVVVAKAGVFGVEDPVDVAGAGVDDDEVTAWAGEGARKRAVGDEGVGMGHKFGKGFLRAAVGLGAVEHHEVGVPAFGATFACGVFGGRDGRSCTGDAGRQSCAAEVFVVGRGFAGGEVAALVIVQSALGS